MVQTNVLNPVHPINPINYGSDKTQGGEIKVESK